MQGMVIAGTHSGCGKTTVTLGLLAALRRKGLRVQSFKTGPDFIDSGIHRIITGRPSRNLDVWMCGEDYVKDCFSKNSMNVDISIVEGVMGLFDGKFSTAALANSLNLPVILVVDAYGMAESARAVVKGFRDCGLQIADCGIYKSEIQNLKSEIAIAGVIFNRVASENHFKRLRDSVRDVPVLGYLPRDLNFEIPHRHLGLTVAEENPIAEENIQRLADCVLKHINVDALSRIANWSNGVMEKRNNSINTPIPRYSNIPIFQLSNTPTIAVAYDKAFCFYYEDNFDLLRGAGAEIVFFSPLSDGKIPDGVDALYIGGGYPELYAKELSTNKTMLDSIRNFADSGMPVYAECGGFMYLSNGIRKMEYGKSKKWNMAGIFSFKTQMKDNISRLGYREIALQEDCILGRKGSVIRGHEFHYSEIVKGRTQTKDNPSTPPLDKGGQQGVTSIYSVKDGTGNDLQDEGYKVKNTLGSYVHVHFGSNPDIADNFINFSRET